MSNQIKKKPFIVHLLYDYEIIVATIGPYFLLVNFGFSTRKTHSLQFSGFAWCFYLRPSYLIISGTNSR